MAGQVQLLVRKEYVRRAMIGIANVCEQVANEGVYRKCQNQGTAHIICAF